MAKTTLPKHSTPLAWSVDRRARIQKILLDLFQFLEKHTEFHQQQDDLWKPLVRMIDIAFSLWRSAFLNQVKRERKAIYGHTIEFLKKVLEQNSITFADDFRMCELTMGYYNSNARYRLERMYLFDVDLLQLPEVQEIEKLRKIDIESLAQDNLWDTFYMALEACVKDYMKKWEKNVAPRHVKKAKRKKTTVAGSKAKRPRSRSRR